VVLLKHHLSGFSFSSDFVSFASDFRQFSSDSPMVSADRNPVDFMFQQTHIKDSISGYVLFSPNFLAYLH